jgi:hypothetical protein
MPLQVWLQNIDENIEDRKRKGISFSWTGGINIVKISIISNVIDLCKYP